MQVTPVEPGAKIQLPIGWSEELKLGSLAALEKTPDGILIRPHVGSTWDDIFATKLLVNSASLPTLADSVEVTRDDLLF